VTEAVVPENMAVHKFMAADAESLGVE